MKTSDAESFLQTALADGPRLYTELKANSGFPERTLQRAGHNLQVLRSRAGESGAWRWSLPVSDSPVVGEYLPQAADKTAKSMRRADRLEEIAIKLFRKQITPPVSVPVAPTIDELLALAEEGGLKYPLRVSSRSGMQWSVRIFQERGGSPEYEIAEYEFTPDETCSYTAVRQQHDPATCYRLLCFDAAEQAATGQAGKLGWYATAR